MKRILQVFACVLVLIFVGCGNDEPSQESSRVEKFVERDIDTFQSRKAELKRLYWIADKFIEKHKDRKVINGEWHNAMANYCQAQAIILTELNRLQATESNDGSPRFKSL